MSNILITGCSRGLGKVLVSHLGKQVQHNIIPHYREYIGLEEDMYVMGDIRDFDTQYYILEFLEKYDIDVFINNAGIYETNCLEEMLATNLKAQIELLSEVHKKFSDLGSGLIINISSLAVKHPNVSEPYYSVTKAGVSSFIKYLQLISKDVQVVDLFIGAMDTEMTKDRKNNSLIEPFEVAKIIDNLINLNISSCYISEMTIRRVN